MKNFVKILIVGYATFLGLNAGSLAVGAEDIQISNGNGGKLPNNLHIPSSTIGAPGSLAIGTTAEVRGKNIIIHTNRGNRVFPRNTSWKTQSGYLTIFQNDGNLVVYNRKRKAVWSSRTHNRGGTKLAMQQDGNLVIYNSKGKALWSSGTYRHRNARLAIQSDGNVVIYNTRGKAVWSTGTHGK